MLGLSWAILMGGALGGGQAAPVAPTIVSVPSLSTSSPVVRAAIAATAGVYTGSPTVTAQWFYGDTGVLVRSDATAGLPYTPVSADVTHTLKYIETATNTGGSVASAAPTTGAVGSVPALAGYQIVVTRTVNGVTTQFAAPFVALEFNP